MIKFPVGIVVLLACMVLGGCGDESPTSAAPVSPSIVAPSTLTDTPSSTTVPSPAQVDSTQAWETYKREVREAGFADPGKPRSIKMDAQTRHDMEAICRGPEGARGIWQLYDISLQMKPQQQVDLPRAHKAAEDFCASVKGNG